MAKEEKKKTDVVEAKNPSAIPEKTDELVAAAPEQPAPVVVEKPTPAVPEIPVSFDRWFGTLDRPPHHKAGMKAFANTSGKKTVAQWAAIFAKY